MDEVIKNYLNTHRKKDQLKKLIKILFSAIAAGGAA